MKTCSRQASGLCASDSNPQPLGNFSKDAKRKDRLTPTCKSCQKAYREVNPEQVNAAVKAWRQRNPERMQWYRFESAEKNTERTRRWREKNRIQSLYGISNAEWQALFDKQRGKCKICKAKHVDLKLGLCVDHCHIFANVRGLLCQTCNQALGLFKDDPALLRKAAAYLEKAEPE